MTYTFRGKELGSFFAISTDNAKDQSEFLAFNNLISIHWNRNKVALPITIDGATYLLESNQITTTTYLQNVSFDKCAQPLTTFTFNREFYCIQDHDSEVSCNGIIFFGTFDIPFITLVEAEAHKFNLLYQVFLEEFKTKDNIQGEMLEMLLKRLIIKITRLAKEQLITKQLDDGQIDLIRKFNVLVDLHHKEKHKVNEYAELLFKSPKTLSNLFAKYNHKKPLQIIHERIILGAKRQLLYTDKTAKEIAFDLGFDDAGSFHKLFKKVIGTSPNTFKKEIKSSPQLS